ncbi:MAG: NADH-quinone oxidoreductase subunit N [Phycisphaerales bacterium JB037]
MTNAMAQKLPVLLPEIVLFLTTCIVMVVGLSPKVDVRKSCGIISVFGLFIAGIFAIRQEPAYSSALPHLMPFIKTVIAGVGLLSVLLLAGVVDRREEEEIAAGARKFNALQLNRAEFYAFFLFSLTGLMLCASATDLIWLFLALELTSLPTYVMVTISTRGTRSQEAGVKYFFLGALGAAIFLYGFAMLYGGTGTTDLTEIREILFEQGSTTGLNPLALVGIVMSIIGIGFKIAAVPMHFYTADVYQGAASPVSAFLAFVPKTAGFIALLLLLAAVGWDWGAVEGVSTAGVGSSLPEPVWMTLWVMAVLTMTVGNVLALMQRSVKRLLAYSSIAHSGYILVGVIAGPPTGENASFADNGLAAVLFYLLVYGITNLGAFAVVSMLERRNAAGDAEEIDSFDALKGLCRTNPVLGWTMVLCGLSLLGLPPLLGFFSKFVLFSAGISAGEYLLVVIMGLNSAIAAFYYLRLIGAPLLEEPAADRPQIAPFPSRTLAGVVSAVAVVALAIVGNVLMESSSRAATFRTLAELHEAEEHRAPAPEEGDAGHDSNLEANAADQGEPVRPS